MSKKSLKLKSWKHLEEVSTKLDIKGEKNYFIPMGYHGLKETKPIIDAEDEIKQELTYHDEHKWDQAGTIVLIGTNY